MSCDRRSTFLNYLFILYTLIWLAQFVKKLGNLSDQPGTKLCVNKSHQSQSITHTRRTNKSIRSLIISTHFAQILSFSLFKLQNRITCLFSSWRSLEKLPNSVQNSIYFMPRSPLHTDKVRYFLVHTHNTQTTNL